MARILPLAWFTLIMVGATAAWPAEPGDAPFLAENNAAMKKMMVAMQVEPTGDADSDFVATMVPHHQGAIDMALAELRYGHNERLRRLAQEIVVIQKQEITVMREALSPGSSHEGEWSK